MSGTDRMTIEFEFSRSDYVAWAGSLQRTPESLRAWQKYRNGVQAMKIAAVFGSGLWLWFVYARWYAFSRVQPEEVALLVAAGAGLAGLWSALYQRLRDGSFAAARARMEQAADSEIARLWQGQKRVTASPEFLEWDAAYCVFQVRWKAVGAVLRRGDLVEIEVGAAEQRFPIPVRAFATEGEERAFVELVERYRDGVGGGVIGAVELLRDRDFACPGCRYNLRGIERAVCPECGREVGLGEVRGA